MSSSYANDLRIEMIGTGDQAGVWGETTNNNLGTLLVDAIAGYTSVAITGTNNVLTANNGAVDQSRNSSIALSGGSGNFNVFAPPSPKLYVFYNVTSYTARIYNSTTLGDTSPAGAYVDIPTGKIMAVWSDGSSFYVQNSHIIGTVAGNVTGNLTGNVTGDVTGNVTGNVTGSAGSLATANFSVVQSGSKLYFKYGSTNIASMDSSGNFTALLNTTAFGTP